MTEPGPGSGGAKIQKSFTPLTETVIERPQRAFLILSRPSTHCRHSDMTMSGWSRYRTGLSLTVLVLTELEHWKGGKWPCTSVRGRRRGRGGKRVGGRRTTSRIVRERGSKGANTVAVQMRTASILKGLIRD